MRFDSDSYDAKFTKEQRGVKHITKLKHPTSDYVMNSYVHNRPMLCKRKDIGSELYGLNVSEIIKLFSQRNPKLSRSIK